MLGTHLACGRAQRLAGGSLRPRGDWTKQVGVGSSRASETMALTKSLGFEVVPPSCGALGRHLTNLLQPGSPLSNGQNSSPYPIG